MSFADFKIHPVAAIFPMIPLGSREWLLLVDDLRDNGQIEPTVWDGDVLIDGRNRELACERLGMTPKRIQWSALDIKTPVYDWIYSKNVTRRNLSQDQLIAVCAELNAVVKRILAEQEKAKTQFKPGASPNPGGKPKAQARMDSCEPEKRDHKTEHARSTVGQVAAAAGASHHKAAQGVALAVAAEKSPEAKQALEAVKAGTVKLKDAVQAVAKPKPSAMKDEPDPVACARRALGKIWNTVPDAEREAFRKQLYKAIDDLT